MASRSLILEVAVIVCNTCSGLSNRRYGSGNRHIHTIFYYIQLSGRGGLTTDFLVSPISCNMQIYPGALHCTNPQWGGYNLESGADYSLVLSHVS